MKTLYCLALLLLLAGISSTTATRKSVNGIGNVKDPEVCEFCELAFTRIKGMFSVYQSQLKGALLNFCKVTGSFSTECTDLVNKYYDKAFDYLVKDFNSTEFCTLITLCPGYSTLSLRGDVCSTCNEIGTLLKYELSKKEVKAQMKTETLQLCRMTGSYEKDCQHMVNIYFDLAYSQFLKFLEANDICKETGICPSNSIGRSAVTTSSACKYCEETIGTLKFFLEEGAGKQAVKSELESLCAKTGPLAAECKIAVDLLFDKIFNYLLKLLNPYTLCEDLHLCKNNSTFLAKSVATSVNASETCTICEETIGTLKVALEQPAIKKEVKTELLSLCTKAGSLSTECKVAVDLIFDRIFGYLLNLLNPYTLCDDLHLCKQTGIKKLLVEKVANDNECLYCVQTIDDIKIWLKRSETEALVKSAVDFLCNNFVPVKSICDFQAKHFDEIYREFLNKISKYTDDEMCTDMGFCSIPPEGQNAISKKEFCPTCTDFVIEARSILKSSEVQDSMKSILSANCKALGEFATVCDSMVNTYFPLFMKAALSYLDPLDVCTEIGFCTGNEVRKYGMIKASSDEFCEICTDGLTELKTELSNQAIQKEIKAEILDICDELESLNSTCRKYVSLYFDFAYTMALGYLNPKTICSDLSLCSSKPYISSKMPVQKVKNSYSLCPFCKLGLAKITQLFSSPQVKAITKNAQLEACKEFGTLSSDCQTFVNAYFDLAYQFIVRTLDQGSLCADMKFCKPSNSSRVFHYSEGSCLSCVRAATQINTKTSNKVLKKKFEFELEKVCGYARSFKPICQRFVKYAVNSAFNRLNYYSSYPKQLCSAVKFCGLSNIKFPVTMKKIQISEEACDFCKSEVKLAVDELSKVKVRTWIKSELIEFCNATSEFKEKCKYYINSYYDLVYQMALNYYQPDQICEEARICTKKVQKTKRTGDEFCSICKVGLQEVKAEMSKDSVKAEAKKEILSVCTELGQTLSKECLKYVNQYFDLAYELALGYLDPATVCSEIGLCSSSLKQTSIASVKKGQYENCPVCKTTLKEGISILKKVKPEVKDEMLSICTKHTLVPKYCQKLVNNYFDIAYDQILSLMEPTKACTKLFHLCDSNSTSTSFFTSTECEICKFSIGEIKKELTSADFKKEVNTLFSELCQEINSTECEDLVKKYLDQVIQVAVQFLNPTMICQELEVCDASTLNVTTSQSSLSCTICQTVTTSLGPEIIKIESKAIDYGYDELQKVCKLLPGDIAPQCTDLVGIYGKAILQMAVNEYGKPSELCSELKIC